MFENYATYAIPRSKFLVADCRLMRVSVTVGSLAHEDMMQLFWTSFVGDHLVCGISGGKNDRS